MSISDATSTRQLNLGQTEPAAAPCGTYTWCAETGQHTTHASAYTEAPTPDGFGDCVLPANIIAETGAGAFAPCVGWLDLDLTAEQTRARVAELHRHLDTVAALADIVDGQAPLEPGTECYSVTAFGTNGALISSEVYRLDDPQPGEPAARIAVFGQPEADADLDVAGADQLVAGLEQFLPRLRAQRNHLAAVLGSGSGGSVRATDGTPGHYSWCNVAGCRTYQYDERDGGGSYVEHVGHETAITLSDGHPADDIRITAGLGADESYTSGPKVYLAVGDLDALGLGAHGVDTTIAQLEALTSALRTMRGQMDSEARP
ncbi:DUF6907 domain-containing protein [Streptomyces sp. NPDC059698]|uniref:DUF6907 domain-containing protein n=1 Tax=unclassified Streptomyces TaxID=2593676 RepID=UPI00093D5225|nr:hypothetical protein [Streptomyces sp. CB02366]OKJ38246.1 hypothetical protein AMK24_11375 [Streptomyces sp. CB02366]